MDKMLNRYDAGQAIGMTPSIFAGVNPTDGSVYPPDPIT